MATGAVAETVASNLEEAAEMTRKIDTRIVGSFVGGIAFGVVLGFFFGYRYNREKIRAEAFEQSEKELDKIREVYQQRTTTVEEKPSVEDLIEKRGYSIKEEEPEDEVIIEEPPRPLKPPVVVTPARRGPVMRSNIDRGSNMEGWDYDAELHNRRGKTIYVIHQDERNELEGYNSTVYNYYAVDDVLTDEDNTPFSNPTAIVGDFDLPFGHGTDDKDVVFVRNERLQLEIEICRLHESWEQEVLGLSPESESEPESEPDGLQHSTKPPPRPRQHKKRRR